MCIRDSFPYEYVHIGGDEVEKDNWRKCADCQRRIAQQGLKGVGLSATSQTIAFGGQEAIPFASALDSQICLLYTSRCV